MPAKPSTPGGRIAAGLLDHHMSNDVREREGRARKQRAAAVEPTPDREPTAWMVDQDAVLGLDSGAFRCRIGDVYNAVEHAQLLREFRDAGVKLVPIYEELQP